MMQLNKYDLVEELANKLKAISCWSCPIEKECNYGETLKFLCIDEDKTKELLMKKYNL